MVTTAVFLGICTNDSYAANQVAPNRTRAEKAFCDSEFARILGRSLEGNASSEMIAAWKALEPKCSGTGLYESRLVGMLVSNGQLAEARKTGVNALNEPLNSKRELLVALAQVELRADNFELAIDYSKRAIKEENQWSGGYTALGEVYLSEERYSESIEMLEAALDRQAGASTAASLCIAYWGAHRYRDAAHVMKLALKTDIDTLRLTKAVAAAADSLVKIDEVPAAKDLLAEHARLVPAARQDRFFLRSVKIVADAMKSAKAE